MRFDLHLPISVHASDHVVFPFSGDVLTLSLVFLFQVYANLQLFERALDLFEEDNGTSVSMTCLSHEF